MMRINRGGGGNGGWGGVVGVCGCVRVCEGNWECVDAGRSERVGFGIEWGCHGEREKRVRKEKKIELQRRIRGGRRGKCEG